MPIDIEEVENRLEYETLVKLKGKVVADREFKEKNSIFELSIYQDYKTRQEMVTRKMEFPEQIGNGRPCFSCKGRNTTMIQKQQCSADEGFTNFLKCLDCGYEVKSANN